MPNEIQKRLAENLKKIRKNKKMTQFELAEKADISEAMVKSIETCHAWPSEKTLLQISTVLETDVYHFFMPIPLSLEIKDKVKSQLQCTVKESYCEYVKTILEKLD